MKVSHVGLGAGLMLLAVSGVRDTDALPQSSPAGQELAGAGVPRQAVSAAERPEDGKSNDAEEGDDGSERRKPRTPRDGGKNDTEDRPDTEESDETALACGGIACELATPAPSAPTPSS